MNMLPLLLLSILCSVLLIDGQTVVNRTFIQQASAIRVTSVCVESSQTFNCTIEAFISSLGFVVVGAVWSRNGSMITDSTPRHTLLRTQHGVMPVVTGLIVDNITLDDNGTVYTCTAENAPDNFTSNVTLNVVGDPPSPTAPVTNDNTLCIETSVFVTWPTYHSDPVCGSVSYSVTISSANGMMNMITTDTSYNFTALMLGTTYTVSVAGVNMAGTGSSEVTMFHRPSISEALPKNITNLMRTTIEPYAITVSWDHDKGRYCQESLYYKAVISSNEDSNIINDTVNATNMTATFSSLESATSYNIMVTAINTAGDGMPVAITNISTISPPRNITGETDDDDDDGSVAYIIVVIVIVIVLLVTIFMTILLFYRYKIKGGYCQDTAESPMPLSSPAKVTPTEMESEVKQDEYATVDKSHAKSHAKSDDKPDQQEPNLSGGINYADLDIVKGPNVMVGGDHAVYYAQTTS